MSKIKNLFYLLLFGGALFSIKIFLVDKVFADLPEDAELWFTSGLLLIILGVFVTEKYFTKSLDVLVNVITLGVVLLTLDNPQFFKLWPALVAYGGIVGALALTSFVLFEETKDQNFASQKIARSTGVAARFLGSSRMLFSIVFLLSIFNYFVFSLEQSQTISSQQSTILLLIGFWAVVLLIEPIDSKLIRPLTEALSRKQKSSLIGKVIKRMSPNLVVVERYPNTKNLKLGDLVVVDDLQQSHKKTSHHALMYLYSENTGNGKMLFFYSLDQNLAEVADQIFVFQPAEEEMEQIKLAAEQVDIHKQRDNLIGFVNPGSDIDILKIRMIEGVDEKKHIKEGDLVSVSFYGSSTKYQIINVETGSEAVDGQSKQGTKIITAQQIGQWKDDRKKFEDIGWVPEVNAPIFLETPSEEIAIPNGNHFKVGIVPKSPYPIFIDLDESIGHHIAIIGKTGTGKSRMAAKILEKMADAGYKVVVFEVDRKNKQSLSKYIDAEKTEEQKSNEFDFSKATKSIISIDWQPDDKDKNGGTLNVSDAAAGLIEKVVEYQTKNEEQKICIVMEEAYDFIPENTFGKQDYGQPKVSRISQMVLKCRKHNIGYLIITQRTALVTKTILYQCHTIIALQSFDETSKNFMSAYINQKYLDSMSILPRYRAIVVGKGSSCDKPVIVDFFDKTLSAEKSNANSETAQ